MPGAAIRLDNVTRTFDGVTAVDGLSLEVPVGGVFGFLGPNGAGKTTTISMILGLLAPDSGTVTVVGRDTATGGDEIRARTGVLLEDNGLYEQMSAEDNLEFYARVCRMSDSARQARIRELLTRMNLWDRRSDKVANWSRGMRQRLALARCLLNRPELVVLDEPTASLDVVNATALRDDLETLTADEGVTAFLSTHNMNEAERMCDEVAVIRHGKLVTTGSPAELRKRSVAPSVEIVGRNFPANAVEILTQLASVESASVQNGVAKAALSPDAEVAPVVKSLVDAGAEIEEVRRNSASLEEVFLALVKEGEEDAA